VPSGSNAGSDERATRQRVVEQMSSYREVREYRTNLPAYGSRTDKQSRTDDQQMTRRDRSLPHSRTVDRPREVYQRRDYHENDIITRSGPLDHAKQRPLGTINRRDTSRGFDSGPAPRDPEQLDGRGRRGPQHGVSSSQRDGNSSRSARYMNGPRKDSDRVNYRRPGR
jgi:hypothetical protein